MKISIDEKYLSDIFYAKRRILLPKDSEFAKYTFFVPIENIFVADGKAEVSIENNVLLKCINKRADVTVEQLQDIFNGKKVENVRKYVVKTDKVLETRLNYLSDVVPKEMQELPNWIVYRTRWNEEKGKKDKTLISTKDGRWAKSNDSTTWTDFATAKTYAIENNFEGLAFALDGNGITCIDLDHSITDGKLSPLAERCLSEMSDTYIETSVSGDGLHIFMKDDILQGKFKNRAITPNGEIEVYDKGRIISMTGNIRTNINTLSPCPPETKMWLRNTLGKIFTERSYVTRQVQGNKSDSEIIERIQKSKKANEFNALYKGESLSGDHSRDDFKLLNILAFFTNCDTMQMERLFRNSGLYRPEKGDKYLETSIKKAVSTLVSRIDQKVKTTQKASIGKQIKFSNIDIDERE